MRPGVTVMSKASAKWIAWSIAGVSGALLAAGVALGLTAMMQSGGLYGLLSHQLTIPFSGAVFIPLGALVLSRHSRHPIAWILAALGVVTGIEVLNLGFLAYRSLQAPGELIPAPDLAHWLAQWIWAPRAMIPITLLLLLFPDGRVPSLRWQPIAWATVIAIVATTIANAFAPGSWQGLGGVVQNPFAVQSAMLEGLYVLSSLLLSACFLASLASVYVRFKGSRGIERLQLKWMAHTVGVIVLLLVAAAALLTLLENSQLAAELTYSAVNLVGVAIAVSVSIAVLRYRLYDIDLIINRTLVYGVLTVIVVGLYAVIVGSLGALFQSRGNLVTSLVATGLIAVLFQPLRDRLQQGVNRLLYGERDEPYNVLSRIGRQLEDAAAPETMLAAIVETIAGTLKLPYVAIALSEESESKVAYESGRRTARHMSLPLHYRGRLVGQLLCAPRSAAEAFSDLERRLLGDIANQAAVAIHAMELSSALQRSREQLVSAREEERRRLRRDLHDGLGPQLASLALKLDAARNQLEVNPGAADDILVEMRGQAQDALRDIRRLVYDLRPPALDELGLLGALRASAEAQAPSGSPRISVVGPQDLPELPAAVEVAVYRIAQEAVTNITRHAQASHSRVRLYHNDGLHLEIRDDGVGLPDELQAGIGLNSMRERAAELGGAFSVVSDPEGGTRVHARFPLADNPP